MGNKLNIYNLVLEVTRRCNMCCAHCLRGEAQNMDMQKETIDKLLDQTDSISMVTFSGGEPSLNIPLIRYFFERVRETGVSVSSFYVATNGKENQMDLAQLLLKEYVGMEEKELSGVSISVDDFHEGGLDFSPVRALSFYRGYKEYKRGDWRWVMSRGRAMENGIGHNERTRNQDFEVDVDSWGVNVGMMYVSADGNVYPDCDLSYEDMLDYPQVPVENALRYLVGISDEDAATVA
jgi:MoaA/NifB/PqqE/SkfB family radical SAM enzyme